MRKTGFWKTDWFLGLAVSGAMLLARNGDLISALERTAYGFGARAPGIPREHFLVTSSWGAWVSDAVFVLAAAYLVLILPRLSSAVGAIATAVLLTTLIAAHFSVFLSSGLWISVSAAAILLLAGHVLLAGKRLLGGKPAKGQAGAESAALGRLRGLAFQAQGQLDLAFDTFRKCALDDALMTDLYNLALDFERQRQFGKATVIYRYMADHDPGFRDIGQRLDRARPAPGSAVPVAADGKSGDGATARDEPPAGRPMLGPYRIEKKLGQGAMGAVYLGRDPETDRVVAIKTMALSQQFAQDELGEAKARFFREVEAAGRLRHPNIVTMYEAGEAQGLAYIAMEFLTGSDLVPFARPDRLLPLPQVVDILARVADGLAYAHANNVIHRDVKPANVMYDEKSGQVKIMDFGIARLTDSSRTRTGTVLGTPSYMSPEQLSGKTIDGRSDIFSLGVMLYQMACGKLPFAGESMAQLMYRIANEAHPDIRLADPRAPDALAAVINRAMSKEQAQRYPTADEMACDLRACLRSDPVMRAGADSPR